MEPILPRERSESLIPLRGVPLRRGSARPSPNTRGQRELPGSAAGKSTLVNLIVAQFFRCPRAQAFGFDLGYSGYVQVQIRRPARTPSGLCPSLKLDMIWSEE